MALKSLITSLQRFSDQVTFQNPLNINAADTINFRSKGSNGSVTQSVVSLIIELDIQFLKYLEMSRNAWV